MQVEYKTEKGVLLFVKIPDDASDLTYPKVGMIDLYFQTKVQSDNEEGNYISIPLPSLGFDLIGLTSEVSEEQAKMIMPRALEKQTDFGINYGYMFSPMDTNIYISGQDAFKALMQHLKVYEVNPFECADDIMTHKNLTLIEYGKADIKHENAETRTGKWVILFKKSCI